MVDDFVGRVYRIEISRDVADYLAGTLELFDRMRGQRVPALPPRLVAIRHALSEACTGVNASADNAGQTVIAGVDTSTKGVAALGLPHSQPHRVETEEAAGMLQMTTNGVRDRCREKELDWVKLGGRYWITVDSIEEYKMRPRPRKRLKD